MSSDFHRKLGAMILLLAESRKVTRTELNKLLFFSDTVHFLKHEHTISGDDYFKRQFGPVPGHVDATRNTLVGLKFLTEQTRVMSLYYQYDYQTRGDNVDLDLVRSELDDDERSTLADVSKKLAKYSATALSSNSHRFEPWKSSSLEAKMEIERAKGDANLREWLRENDIAVPQFHE